MRYFPLFFSCSTFQNWWLFYIYNTSQIELDTFQVLCSLCDSRLPILDGAGVWILAFSSFRCIPSSRIARSYCKYMFKFLGTGKFSSTVIETVCIPSNNTWAFQVLCILVNTCYFQFLFSLKKNHSHNGVWQTFYHCSLLMTKTFKGLPWWLRW